MLLASVWWIRLAPADEMVRLFEEPTALNPQQIVSALASRGIACEMQGGEIYVPSRVRGEAVAVLAWDGLLPRDSSSTFSEAIDKISSFDVRQKIDARLLNATREQLKYTIEALPGVASASIFLNPVHKRQIGESLYPTASVSLTTRTETDVHRLAEAVSCLLASAFPAMRPENVTVVVDGSLISAAGADDLLSARELHARGEAERYFAAKVREALGGIPGLVASVTVDAIAPAVRPPVAIAVQPVDEAASGQVASADRGGERPLSLGDILCVLATRGPDSSAAATSGGAQRDQRRFLPTGGSLVVPMSWMVQQWQSRNRTSELPPPEELRQFEDATREELRRVAAITLGGIPSERVSIIVDADAALADDEPPPPMLADNPEDSPAISALVHNWGREVALAAMGAVSVLLVSAMLKKSTLGGVVTESTLNFAPEGIDPATLEYLAGEPLFASEQVLDQARSMMCGDTAA
jgi:type III secretory pathway lipoprotein EscJ